MYFCTIDKWSEDGCVSRKREEVLPFTIFQKNISQVLQLLHNLFFSKLLGFRKHSFIVRNAQYIYLLRTSGINLVHLDS